MANLIPSLSSCLRRMQDGEKRFARRLEALLEDDYLCWYEIPVGVRQRYTDFIILHPLRGLLLLEVKDWNLVTIQSMNKADAVILTPSGPKTTANPLEQARQCAYQLVNRLQADPQLRSPQGRYKGRLAFPYGYGVVLSRITRRQFEGTNLGEVLPPHLVLCKDEMVEGMDAEAFQERLWNMFNQPFPCQMTLPQIDQVRWHLFPEVRISDTQRTFFDDHWDEADPATLLPDMIKVMDIQQEQLARSLGEGHRVIHGVAGSGKTLILGYRCLHLAKLLHKPILVLCFNIALAARLRSMMEDKQLADRVHVYHFHDWCGEQLRRYHVETPLHNDAYVHALVQRVIDSVEQGRIPTAQYGALMIDEGHDFQPEWLKLVVRMVDPESDSLLLLYDDAQSLYHDKSTLNFSLSSVGIQARGRTSILRLNYRNTTEILDFAYRFAKAYLGEGDNDEDHVPVVEPQSAGRHGDKPALKIANSFQGEIDYTIKVFRDLHQRGMAWREMCITYHSAWMGKELEQRLRTAQIPVQWLADSRSKRAFDSNADSVKLMTMHSSKGLEFPLVAVMGVGYMPVSEESVARDAKLLYVAMTRSTDKLLVTCHRQSPFVASLSRAEGVTRC